MWDTALANLDAAMKMRKIIKRLALGLLSLIVVLVAALIFGIAGPRPEVHEGTERPSWLPVASTDVFYRFQVGFGWWKAAEFTIAESDFRAFAAKEGWTLTQETDFPRPGHLQLLRPKGREPSEDDLITIPRALVYDRRAGNNGGITVAFDPSESKAYYAESHR